MSPTLAPTSCELTSTVETMASFNKQAIAPSVTKLVLPIKGGSSLEPANRKQKKEAQRRVQHVGVQGPFVRSKWSHIPITFSQEDLQLKDYPHNDAIVISCVIKGFLVHNVLVDTGSVWRNNLNYSSLSVQVVPLRAATHLNKNNPSVPRI
jgi:hypothetical protein